MEYFYCLEVHDSCLPFFLNKCPYLLISHHINTYNDLYIACGPLDKPAPVKTHLRNMIILPEMVGSTLAIYNGKVFNLVDIKADMIGYYLAEFSISYRPVRHGRPGLGSTNSSRFIPLK